MSDVVVGGLLAILAGLVGGLGGVLVQGHLSRASEQRAQDRARADRLREFRADSLWTAYRQFVATRRARSGSERAGESPEQIARLRTQIESHREPGRSPDTLRAGKRWRGTGLRPSDDDASRETPRLGHDLGRRGGDRGLGEQARDALCPGNAAHSLRCDAPILLTRWKHRGACLRHVYSVDHGGWHRSPRVSSSAASPYGRLNRRAGPTARPTLRAGA